ncbi:MAG: SGNH/GDSL hydrolase family protein [Bacteroidales bacterium]|nr:SGNH/GDSL hydrolase family protein [Bacteroidales bacterium]
MRPGFLFIFLLLSSLAGSSRTIKVREPVRFLALGDSYTIGQSVAITDRWPSQFLNGLTNLGYNVGELKIIAQTGWRTDNLKSAIGEQLPLTGNNLVSLLIGVNNQFQGGSSTAYANEFEDLLRQAILLAGGSPRHVFVLSIPDYAFTPFGNGNPAISDEIDEFNEINRIISEEYQVSYIDITPISRKGLAQPDLVASDGLHPSGLMYDQWVQEILKCIEKDVGMPDNQLNESKVSFSLLNRYLKLNNTGSEAGLAIYDVNGKKIIEDRLPMGDLKTLNLSGLTGGLYFLVVRNQKRMIYKTKLLLF